MVDHLSKGTKSFLLCPVPKEWIDRFEGYLMPTGIGANVLGTNPPPEGKWYWPVESEADMNNLSSLIRKPRYPDLFSAVVVALKANHQRIIIAHRSRGDFGGLEKVILDIRDFYDDPDYFKAGATEKWWKALVAKAKPKSKPVAHKGDDDSMW